MSKVYQQFNSVTGVAGVAFGGGGGGGRRSRRRRKESRETSSTTNAFSDSGPAWESEQRKTGNSNSLMNAKMQEDIRINPPDHARTIGNVAGVTGLIVIRANPAIGATATVVGLVANNWP